MQTDESESPTMVAGGGASAVYSLLSLSPRRSTVSNLSRSSIDFQSSPQERALVSQLLNKIGLYPEESSPEAKSPIVNGAAYHPVKKYGSLDQLGPPPPKRIVQASYTELQRAVAETPLMWADENPFSSSGTNERKRDSTVWLYSSATSYQLESWSATSSATLKLYVRLRAEAAPQLAPPSTAAAAHPGTTRCSRRHLPSARRQPFVHPLQFDDCWRALALGPDDDFEVGEVVLKPGPPSNESTSGGAASPRDPVLDGQLFVHE
ncbi:uncharacterized protein PGTG_22795 [Puccinia graminis f. sp. tritici CRL 75-36-700-3]|uniref:Uncharacterized protein n=1 Tax=Puccinia graminis f. sp. tritici (strain CRL 75-36-700-3 / race SCCL) TaxID=418459 RepID=H6QVM4_PUCGT|nr:uncharacterized protein PGTG_22795 [Puccinia graminis f. sp. tritici CRL 75-36-700-3]EHS63380.1 hypothetical protein PGTG_22795 [Puccinia graminis f. sp. tritici CRL 75-36-700-3]